MPILGIVMRSLIFSVVFILHSHLLRVIRLVRLGFHFSLDSDRFSIGSDFRSPVSIENILVLLLFLVMLVLMR